MNHGTSACRLRPLILACALLVAACTDVLNKNPDFDRHRYSRLVQPMDQPGKMYFDVIFTADFPQQDPAADAARMQWLARELQQRRLCASGFEVIVRRPFDYLEDNPAGFQERWEVRCTQGGG